MERDRRLCELHRLDDASALSDVAQALEARGIKADVWPERRRRLIPAAARTWRLMVRCEDAVYARWVAAAVGLDTWADGGEEGAGAA